MRRLFYNYHMKLNFEFPVHEHHFKLRCFPASDSRQKIFNERIEIYPVHFRSYDKDSFGNLCVYGTASQDHDYFAVDVQGTADIDIDGKITSAPQHAAMFKYDTALTKAGSEILKFHRSFDPMNYMNGLERAEYILDPTHNRKCDDSYIKISSGRDAGDCSINQGVFYGGGRQTQEVKVIVNEV